MQEHYRYTEASRVGALALHAHESGAELLFTATYTALRIRMLQYGPDCSSLVQSGPGDRSLASQALAVIVTGYFYEAFFFSFQRSPMLYHVLPLLQLQSLIVARV